jgi:hypothetical protein
MRPVLQASRIQSFLAQKKLSHRTRDRLTKRLGDKLMRAQGKAQERIAVFGIECTECTAQQMLSEALLQYELG